MVSRQSVGTVPDGKDSIIFRDIIYKYRLKTTASVIFVAQAYLFEIIVECI